MILCFHKGSRNLNKEFFKKDDWSRYQHPDSTSYLCYFFIRDTLGRPIEAKSFYLFKNGRAFNDNYTFSAVNQDTSSYKFVPLWKTLRSASGTVSDQEKEIISKLDSTMTAYSPYLRDGYGQWAYNADTLEIRRCIYYSQCAYRTYITKFIVKDDTLIPFSRGIKNKPTDSENVDGIFYKRQKVQSVN